MRDGVCVWVGVGEGVGVESKGLAAELGWGNDELAIEHLGEGGKLGA